MSPSKAIEQAIKAPAKQYSKSEAREMLKKYGVLNRRNEISNAYKGIIVKTKDN